MVHVRRNSSEKISSNSKDRQRTQIERDPCLIHRPDQKVNNNQINQIRLFNDSFDTVIDIMNQIKRSNSTEETKTSEKAGCFSFNNKLKTGMSSLSRGMSRKAKSLPSSTINSFLPSPNLNGLESIPRRKDGGRASDPVIRYSPENRMIKEEIVPPRVVALPPSSAGSLEAVNFLISIAS